MRTRRLALALSCGAMALLAACGSGDKAAPPSPTATGATTSIDSSDQQSQTDALLHSSSSASTASSFAGTFHMTISLDGKTIDEDGTMAFRAPSTFSMTMNLLGQSFSVLVDAPDVYMNVPGKGWFSLGDSLINRDAYAQYAKNRGPIDYSSVMNGLKDHEQLGDEQIDDKTYVHYSGKFDLAGMLDKIPSDVFKQAAEPGLDALRNLAPATIEAWLDPDTDLPRRMTMDMAVPIAGKDMSMSMDMDYTSWNESVDIPAAPTDARPYSELAGALKP